MRTMQFRIALTTLLAFLLTTRWGIAETPVVDFRYKPFTWQSLICMPCDPVKTLVDKEGAMFNVAGIKLVPLAAANAECVSQELADARTPIVRTHQRAGDLKIVEEAFVSPIAADAARVTFPFVDRIGWQTTVRDCAAPTKACEPAFRHAAVGGKEVVHFSFHAKKKQTYTVVFGFCEGADNKPGDRCWISKSKPGTAAGSIWPKIRAERARADPLRGKRRGRRSANRSCRRARQRLPRSLRTIERALGLRGQA